MKYYIVGFLYSLIGFGVISYIGLPPLTGLGIASIVVGYGLFARGRVERAQIKREKDLLSTKLPDRHNLI